MSGTKSIQIYNIESIAKKMVSEYHDITDMIEHMGTRGASREETLKKYLSELIPQKYQIGTGIITDIEGTQSKQQDLFIYDAFNSPVFLKRETSVIIPVESVYATIEVKSSLSKETLKQSIENIRSVKQLKQTQLKNSVWIPNYHNFIFGSVFAYTADVSIDTLHKNVIEICNDIPSEEWPSLICVFDKGLFVNVRKNDMRKIEIVPSDQTMWVEIVNDRDVNLYLFYLLLQQHLNATTNFPPDLIKYAEASHKLDSIKTTIRSELIPDDMTMTLGKATLNANELRKLGEVTPMICNLLKPKQEGEEIQDIESTNKRIREIIGDIEPIIQKTIGVDRIIDIDSEQSAK